MSTPEIPKHVPPVPRYGEYAPVDPAQSAPPAPQPPVYQPMGSQQGYPQPGYQQQGYPQPGYPQPGYPQPGYYGHNGPRPLRTGDMIASVILLVVGFFGVLITVLNAFTIDGQMEAMYDQYGIDGDYVPGAGAAIAAAVLIISHLVIYALAVIFTIMLLRKRRMSFWLPLSAGVLAGVIFFATFIALVFADPALLEAAMRQ